MHLYFLHTMVYPGHYNGGRMYRSMNYDLCWNTIFSQIDVPPTFFAIHVKFFLFFLPVLPYRCMLGLCHGGQYCLSLRHPSQQQCCKTASIERHSALQLACRLLRSLLPLLSGNRIGICGGHQLYCRWATGGWGDTNGR